MIILRDPTISIEEDFEKNVLPQAKPKESLGELHTRTRPIYKPIKTIYAGTGFSPGDDEILGWEVITR